MDDYRVAVDAHGHPFLLTHLTPGLCQFDSNNPGFQVMRYNRATGALEDLATYIIPDLRTAAPAANPWRLEYDFDQAFGYSAYTRETWWIFQGASPQTRRSGKNTLRITDFPHR